MFGNSRWSSTLISRPLASTMTAVTKTIAPAALRTETGSRRKRDIRRSIRMKRAIAPFSGGVAPRLEQVSPLGECWREAGRHDQDGRGDHQPEEQRHHDSEPAVVLRVPLEPVREQERRDCAHADQRERREDGTG